MYKRFLILSLIPLLAGCALFGPGVKDPALQNEYKAAQNALEEAEHLKAKNYVPQKFSKARDKFMEVHKDHLSAPSREIIAEYRHAQILANRAAIDSLQQQLAEKVNRSEVLKQELESNRGKVKQFKQKWENEQNHVQVIEGKLDNYLDTVASIREEKQKIQEQYEAQKSRVSLLEQEVDKTKQEKKSLRKEKEQLSQEVNHYQQVVTELEKKLKEIQKETENLRSRLEKKASRLQELRRENKSIAKEFKQKIKNVKVRKESRGVVVNLDTKILFEIGDIRLVDGAKKTLKKVAAVLKKYPDREIRVGGHTDDLPIREAYPSNWELSARRALKVLKYLAYSEEIDKKRIAAVAYGQFHPLVPNTSDKNRRLNRRVEISLLPPELPAETKDVIENKK